MSIPRLEFLPTAGAADQAADSLGQGAQTDLIARLAAELYRSGAAQAASPDTAAAAHVPSPAAAAPSAATLPPVPASAASAGIAPVAPVGLPVQGGAGTPVKAGAPASPVSLPASLAPAARQGQAPAPAAGADNNSVELAGGFPATTSSAGVPPVHPSVVDADPDEPAASHSDGAAGGDPAGGQSALRAGEGVPSVTRRLHRDDGYEFGEPYLFSSQGGRSNGSQRAASPVAAPEGVLQHAEPAPESVAESAFYFLPQSGNNGAASSRSGNSAATNSGADWASVLGQPASAGFDIQAVRRDFPALHQFVNGKPLVWLDNAATTHKPQAVIDATSDFYARDNSNIHRAAHTLAARSTDLFEAGREKVRQFLGAGDAHEIVFVRGTTEAINLVAQSFGRRYIGQEDEILVTELEHHANIVPWQILAAQVGAVLRVIPINDRGELIVEKIPELITSRTKIVSVAHVSNSLGTVNPVQEIIALAHSRGVPVLVDGAQSTPHIPINVQALDADFYVFSGHKIFAPTGIGALYAKRQWLEALPAWQGGGHMIKDVTFEKTVFNGAPEKFEAGTPDIAGVVGLGAAIDYLFGIGIPALAAYEHNLLEYATRALAAVPGLRPIGTAANKASVLSFVIPGYDNTRLARYLDEQGIAVRAGHHCAQPAIRHFGLESSVRPSLAFYNTYSEVDALVAALQRFTRR